MIGCQRTGFDLYVIRWDIQERIRDHLEPVLWKRNWHERGYSSAYIARELVGCREEEVSRLLRALLAREMD